MNSGSRRLEQGRVEALEKLGDNFKAIQITRTIPPDADPSRFLKGREPIPWKA